MAEIFQALRSCAPQLREANQVLVGFSGGLDSTVLLHQLAQLQLPKLTAVHIDHQLSAEAKTWGEHCRQVSAALGVAYKQIAVELSREGRGLEAAARDARYCAFASIMHKGDVLLTAHHAGDQAETLLFRLVRGAGLKGLAGVPKQRNLCVGGGATAQLLRPLLGYTREELRNYAQSCRLSWVEDESNQQTDYDRNYLRNDVMPLLQSRWPQAQRQLAKAAGLLAENQSLLDEYAAEDYANTSPRRERVGESLCLHQLESYSASRQKHLLRYWVGLRYHLLPSQQHLLEIEKLLAAADDAAPEVCWGECSVRRFKQRLYLLPRLVTHNAQPLPWCSQAPLTLGQGFTLTAQPAETGLAAGDYTVRYRRGGERCRPENRAKSQMLKKLLLEYKLEPWLRDRIPLIYCGEELVAVGDLWICDSQVQEGGIRLNWLWQGC